MENQYRGGVYARFGKRVFDCTSALLVLVVLSPVFLLLTIIGAVAMRGNPFFTQLRPGRKDPKTGQEVIFRLIKFRTMTNQKDKNGKLLPDKDRLNAYGRILRKSSLDELPQLLNILGGSYSLVGPRAMLVRDMVFMSEEVRRRHLVYPGITGLAQASGRNSISWEEKFRYDLQYIDSGITFFGDIKILLKTVMQVFKTGDVVRAGTVSDMDYGDWLLQEGVITEETYRQKQEEALVLLRPFQKN